MTDSRPPATIFILSHMGAGDHLICLPIYRHFAETHNVIIPCKRHNVPSVQWMVRGLPIALLAVDDDEGAKRLAAVAEKRGHQVLRLGMFGKGFDVKHWDSCMYAQAGIPFEKRWTDWKVDRDLSREFETPSFPYAFVHEDIERGFEINDNLLFELPEELCIQFAKPGRTDNIFDYRRLIENATELHLIDSCFAILADSLPKLKCKRFVVHHYARNGLMPTYRYPVEILR